MGVTPASPRAPRATTAPARPRATPTVGIEA